MIVFFLFIRNIFSLIRIFSVYTCRGITIRSRAGFALRTVCDCKVFSRSEVFFWEDNLYVRALRKCRLFIVLGSRMIVIALRRDYKLLREDESNVDLSNF